jgi:hypothetical protein
MGDGLAIDPDSIDRAADDLQSVADRLDQLLDQFAGQLNGVGDPWGTDMLGMLIGGGYVAIESLALKTYESVVASFDNDAEALAGMAESFREVEQGNRDDLDRLGRQV